MGLEGRSSRAIGRVHGLEAAVVEVGPVGDLFLVPGAVDRVVLFASLLEAGGRVRVDDLLVVAGIGLGAVVELVD